MNVQQCMTPNPVAIYPEISCSAAFRLMREKNIRRLPVVDHAGYLLGIVTEKNLLHSWPFSAALLSASEIDERASRTLVEAVMAREVISISENCALEEAARLLVDHKISGLPVTRERRLVGIVTRTDILKVMMEALGGRAQGLRVTLRLCQDRGEIGAVTDAIIQLGGTLLSLSTFWGSDPFKQLVVLKVEGVDLEELLLMLEKIIGVQVIDYRKLDATAEEPYSLMEVFRGQQVDLDGNRLMG